MYDKLGRTVLLRLMTAEKAVLNKMSNELLEREHPANHMAGFPDEYTAGQIDRSWEDAVEQLESDPFSALDEDEIRDAVADIVAVIAGGFFGRDAEKVKQFIEKGKANK